MILSRNHNGKRMNHGCVIFLCENSKKLCRISEISNPGNSVRRTSVPAPERYPAPELSLPCHDVVLLPNLNEQIVARNNNRKLNLPTTNSLLWSAACRVWAQTHTPYNAACKNCRMRTRSDWRELWWAVDTIRPALFWRHLRKNRTHGLMMRIS